MNRLFYIPILSLFLLVIPAIGIFLTILVIAVWFAVKHSDIYDALTQVNLKHDVQDIVDRLDETAINTKKYKRGEVSETELEKGI